MGVTGIHQPSDCDKLATLTPDQQGLLARLGSYQIGPTDAGLTFAMRLARENRWSLSFSDRVIAEYKRFLFLACEAGHPVTPSDQVDQAWHLHLVYTEDYWNGLCAEVLHKKLHHGPTKGGDAEKKKYDGWYKETRESYFQLFGELPPADIWPEAKVRFGRDLNHRRVNLDDFWLVPKIQLRSILAAAALLTVCAFFGCGMIDNSIGESDGKTFLFYYGILSFICAAISLINWKSAPRDFKGYLNRDLWRCWPIGLALVIGGLRLYIGLERGKPVGYLEIIMALNMAAFLGLGDSSGPGRGGGTGADSGGCSAGGCGGGGCGGCGGD